MIYKTTINNEKYTIDCGYNKISKASLRALTSFGLEKGKPREIRDSLNNTYTIIKGEDGFYTVSRHNCKNYTLSSGITYQQAVEALYCFISLGV